MINYEPYDSPFYEANKKYCETVVSKLKTLNLDCSGFCNSFGYEIATTLKKNDLTYDLKFIKNQASRGGGVIPFNAENYEGSEIRITGLNKKFNVTVGKSSLKRIFSSKKWNDKITSPYFMKFNFTPDNNFVDELVKKILDDKISTFKLSDGRLECKIHTITEDPLQLIADIEKTIKNWA